MSISSRIVQFAFVDYEEYTDSKSGCKMQKARCKFCKLFTSERPGTTSNFVRHLRRKHPSKMVDKLPGKDSEPFGEKIYMVAAMLDPQFALQWVDLFVDPRPKGLTSKEQLQAEVKESLKDLLQAELEAVKPRPNDRSELRGSEEEEEGHLESPPRKRPNLFPGLGRSRKQSGDSASSLLSSQKAKYFEMQHSSSDNPMEQGPLPFWRQWKTTLPTMYQLAMKVFSVVATSAPVERVFSQGGIILRPHRACMNAKTLSRLVFIKCNERYVNM